MRTSVFATTFTIILLVVTGALAEVPHQINYQGMLTDTSGNPINEVITRMTFSLYADSVGGGSLWSEIHSGVPVTDGLFRVTLGADWPVPASLFDGSTLWLGVMVTPDGQDMTPRQPLVSVPYGFKSQNADHAVTADTARWAEDFQVPLHVTGDTVGTAIIWGTNNTETGMGIKGENAAGNYGYLGSGSYGVYGEHVSSGNFGYFGSSQYGAYGKHESYNKYGLLGATWAGAFGKDLDTQNLGGLGHSLRGAYGQNSNGNRGYLGEEECGVYGQYGWSGPNGYIGSTNYGAYGEYTNGNYGYSGSTSYGAYGYHNNGNSGALGTSSNGVYGLTGSTNGYGGYFLAYATGASGIFAWGSASGYAAEFRGNVIIKHVSTGATVMELGEGLDYAEGFHVSDETGIAPGTVLIIDPDHSGKLTISDKSYDSKVAGIVAGGKGLGSGVRLGSDEFDYDVALAGRVYCNVDATETGVEAGDLLTTSTTPGYAMKASDYSRAPGAILGKAMEKLERGEKGQILVLVTLQ